MTTKLGYWKDTVNHNPTFQKKKFHVHTANTPKKSIARKMIKDI